MRKFKLVAIITQWFDETPDWAIRANLETKRVGNTVKVKTWSNEFYDTEQDMLDRIEELTGHIRPDEFDQPIIKYHGVVIIDDEFVDFCKQIQKLINQSGEFAFSYRKQLRKECRDKIISNTTDKRERQDKLAFFNYYC